MLHHILILHHMHHDNILNLKHEIFLILLYPYIYIIYITHIANYMFLPPDKSTYF